MFCVLDVSLDVEVIIENIIKFLFLWSVYCSWGSRWLNKNVVRRVVRYFFIEGMVLDLDLEGWVRLE